MPKQLTIFDVAPVIEFDIKKAKVKYSSSQAPYADVVVQVPRRAKAIDELKKTTAQDDRYDLFDAYAVGIWCYKRATDKYFNWEAAEQLCKQARDKKWSIPIRIYLEQSFVPEYVVNYL